SISSWKPCARCWGMNERVALVTGASRGIGRGIALALAKKGWAVAINYRGQANAAQATAQDVIAAGGRSLVVQADIGQSADRERLVSVVTGEFGRLDLLVNNAGMAPVRRMDILETTEASYDQVMTVNLKGPFFLTQRVANLMIQLLQAGTVTHPMIVNIGSMSAYTSSPNRG